MLTKQHTPGPWVVTMAPNGHTAVYPIVGNEVGAERVADVYCPLNVEGGHIGANARLIAAAPEMLEMLRDLFADYYATLRDNHGLAKRVGHFSGDDLPLVKRTRALLAKIEGEQT